MPNDGPTKNPVDELRQYSRRFVSEVIKGSETNILLHASDYVKDPQLKEHAAFELYSGVLRKEFVTLWELFDEQRMYEECIEHLATLIQSIGDIHEFDAVVTCTETARHIVEQLHSEIESKTRSVTLRYLGNHAYASLADSAVADLAGFQVLLVTDVVATGSLLRHLAEAVERRGGTVVAAVTVVDTTDFQGRASDVALGPTAAVAEPDDSSNQARTKERSGLGPIAAIAEPDEFCRLELRYGVDLFRSVRLYALAALPIEPISPEEVPGGARVYVDPAFILPRVTASVPAARAPLVDIAETYRHLEQADALRFGLYGGQDGGFTMGVDFHRLLECCGDDIWKLIKDNVLPHLPEDMLLATTFDRSDLLFSEYMMRWLGFGRKRRIHVPARDAIEAPDSYFLLPGDSARAENKHVLLTLATVASTNKLRSIAALLATKGATAVTAVCLVNRTPPGAFAFVARTTGLKRGEGEHPAAPTDLRMWTVYGLRDLGPTQIARMRHQVTGLSQHFERSTRSPSFARLLRKDQKYFQLEAVTSRSFRKAKAMSMVLPYPHRTADGVTISVKTFEGKLSVLIGHIVEHRDYKPLRQEVERFLSPDFFAMWLDLGVFLKIISLLVTDVGHLKLIGELTTFRDLLLELIRALRSRRLTAEHDTGIPLRAAQSDAGEPPDDVGQPLSIERFVTVETYVLFGLAILAYYDSNKDYLEHLRELVTGGLLPETWKANPRNFMAFFGNERVPYTISMLFHLTYPEKDEVEGSRKERAMNALHAELCSLRAELERRAPDLDVGEDGINLVRQNLGLLIEELAPEAPVEPHRVVEFLQEKLVYVRHEGHDPVMSSLNGTIDRIESRLLLAKDSGTRIDDPIDLNIIETGLHAVGVLEQIGSNVTRVFEFADVSREKVRRFLVGGAHETFMSDVASLGELLHEVRTTHIVRVDDLDKMRRLLTRIRGDLWESRAVQEVLIRYVSDVAAIAREAAGLARADVTRWLLGSFDIKLGNEQVEQMFDIRGARGGVHALCEQTFLVQVLRNILTNCKHGLDPKALHGARAPRLPLASLTVSRREEIVEITVITHDGSPMQELPSTGMLRHHQSQLTRFGGELVLASRSGATATGNELIVRLKPRQSVPSEPGEAKPWGG